LPGAERDAITQNHWVVPELLQNGYRDEDAIPEDQEYWTDRHTAPRQIGKPGQDCDEGRSPKQKRPHSAGNAVSSHWGEKMPEREKAVKP
jgi:hypothetical protein